MHNHIHTLSVVLTLSLVTLLLRGLPFVIFRRSAPEPILYLGRVLPCAIIGMLIVYCLKNVSVFSGSHGIPEAVCVLLVVALHKWKHNTLLSILGGTVVYMLLIQGNFHFF